MIFLGCLTLTAQEGVGKKHLKASRSNPVVKTRIGISPVIGLYQSNLNHSFGARQKMALSLSLKEEIRLDHQNRCFLMCGAEYLWHGVNFKSYYFYVDSIKLYHGAMSAVYDLTIHEVNVPLQLKYSLKKETNSIFSSYVVAGYCYRYIVASQLRVANNGNPVIHQSEKLTFKIPALNSASSSFLTIGGGVQKNIHSNHRAIFAELQCRYALSPFYFNESFAPTSMYISSHFMYLTVGFKI